MTTNWQRPAALAVAAGVLLVLVGNFPTVPVMAVAIAAVGLTFVTAAGGVDLSLGAVAALAGSLAGQLATRIPLPLALAASIGVGVACGLTNGLLVTRGRWPAFLVTFGMLGVAGGVATEVHWDGTIQPDPIVVAVVAVVVAVVAHVVLDHTAWGFHVSFAGSNDIAAEHAGIAVATLRVWTYVVAGTLAAVAGIAMPIPGSGLQLQVAAVAAVLLGGSPLSGGRATVLGAVLGATVVELAVTLVVSP